MKCVKLKSGGIIRIDDKKAEHLVNVLFEGCYIPKSEYKKCFKGEPIQAETKKRKTKKKVSSI